jgi:hypothetical protein
MRAALALLATAAVAAAGCGSDDDSKEKAPKAPDPADFTTRIDNPYWPMAPGSRWVYRETDGEGGAARVEVTVTNRTKRVASGVEARVVHDLVTEDGEPVEDTFDWYAQDRDGNVWYLGEDTKEYEDGKVVSTKDYTPLEPKVLEYKLYAKGVGPVLVLSASGGSGREELLSFRRGG